VVLAGLEHHLPWRHAAQGPRAEFTGGRGARAGELATPSRAELNVVRCPGPRALLSEAELAPCPPLRAAALTSSSGAFSGTALLVLVALVPDPRDEDGTPM
jgi:hypothetical protein